MSDIMGSHASILCLRCMCLTCVAMQRIERDGEKCVFTHLLSKDIYLRILKQTHMNVRAHTHSHSHSHTSRICFVGAVRLISRSAVQSDLTLRNRPSQQGSWWEKKQKKRHDDTFSMVIVPPTLPSSSFPFCECSGTCSTLAGCCEG